MSLKCNHPRCVKCTLSAKLYNIFFNVRCKSAYVIATLNTTKCTQFENYLRTKGEKAASWILHSRATLTTKNKYRSRGPFTEDIIFISSPPPPSVTFLLQKIPTGSSRAQELFCTWRKSFQNSHSPPLGGGGGGRTQLINTKEINCLDSVKF